ncbi:F-box/LRR-repeat MAX2 homolog A-like [Diospyros lotus]|uniref:F-box/LRR-repeat MAX2 homolog A-like n=1 Tax=Diospyros lotus TaxID=55363 RepID=UPI0022507B55|nr:F-box/LRR-repeat MAX2 homolog A-like [Diospyros lotus]
MAAAAATTMNDLPDVILSIIIAAVSDTRSRNAVALVCRKWLVLERATRASLSLRANVRDLVMAPNCFQSVTRLDLSLLSPWGHSLLATSTDDAHLLAQFLGRAFPAVAALTVYARTPDTLELLAPQWPYLTDLKLVRWHQRPSELPSAADFEPLVNHFRSLSSLDLSSFYCWTDDIPLALESAPNLAANLTRLNLLNPSFADGFKSDEIKTITAACRNLKEFLVACVFDHRYIGYVSDETLLSISANCSKLSLLHLVDASALLNPRGVPDDWGFTAEDARISPGALIDMFAALPLLEELTLDVCKNVRESRLALEDLNSKCPKLKSLKLGQFHGLCRANESTLDSRLDGIALCQRLESLSIKNSADLTDLGLIAIARGCSKLAKFEVQGCSRITVRGMRTLACLLRRTLVEVKISGCRNLGAVSSLKALEPVQDRIERLHMDCVWDSVEQSEALQGIEYNFDLNKSLEGGGMSQHSGCQFADPFDGNAKKKCKYWYDSISSYMEEDAEIGNRRECETFVRTWARLRYLSIWIGVGELLSPLSMVGLENCPDLEEIWIKVEGDCRGRLTPSERAFGLSSLQRYPRLRKMDLNCGDIIGYRQTAPSGKMDLSLWERFYLFGIKNSSLSELDYWPPQDPDVNQRSLSLPAAGLLAECSTLRKLFIHGTAHEHFMRMLLNIRSLRDVQLRGDYYPAPENDMSTEMRAVSCCRFEDALNMHRIDD